MADIKKRRFGRRNVLRKMGLCLLLLFNLALLNPSLPQLKAKMSVFSPEHMIEISDYIVVGKIEKFTSTKTKIKDTPVIHSEATISMKSVLKGDLALKEIVLKRDTRTDIMIPSGVSFAFPKKGTQVMLLLKDYESTGISLTYANSICIIQKGKIQLYDGMGFGSNDVRYLPEDYEKAYQAFYDRTVAPAHAREHEDPYQRLVLTLLTPYIQGQLNEFYKNKLSLTPQFAPFLRGTDLFVDYHSSYIDVHVTCSPYVGPHLDVGVDLIKIRIDNTGEVTVSEYKHLKDIDLPPHYKQYDKRSS